MQPPASFFTSLGDSQVNSSRSRARDTFARTIWLRRVAAAGRCPECQTARTMARDRRPHVRDACAQNGFLPREGKITFNENCYNYIRRLCALSTLRRRCNNGASSFLTKHARPYCATHRNGLNQSEVSASFADRRTPNRRSRVRPIAARSAAETPRVGECARAPNAREIVSLFPSLSQ